MLLYSVLGTDILPPLNRETGTWNRNKVTNAIRTNLPDMQSTEMHPDTLSACVPGSRVDPDEKRPLAIALRILEECLGKILDDCPRPKSISALEDGRYIAVNEPFLRMCDLTREAIIGHTPAELGIWTESDHEIKIKQTLKAKGEIRTLELQCCNKHGNHRLLNLSAEIVKIDDQEFVMTTVNDITGGELTDVTFQESEEEFYRDLSQHSRDLICAHDLTGRIIWVNQAAARISGYDPSFFVDKNIRDLLMPEFRQQFEEYLARIQRDGYAEGVMQVGNSAGERRIWEYHNTLCREGIGAPVVRGIAHDITDVKRTEDALSQGNNILKAVIEGTSDAIFVKDLQGRYLMVNQTFARFIGKSVEEVIGKHDTEIFSSETMRFIRETDRKVTTSGETQTYVFNDAAADSTRTYLVSKDPYRNNSGKTMGVIGISRDITERKQAEERLREQAALLDQARDAITVRDLEHRVIFWNSGAERIYGWTAPEVVGRDARAFLYRETDLPHFNNAHASLIQEGEWVGELRQLTKGGKEILVDSRWTLVLGEDRHPKSILIINTDITEKKELEAKLLRAQRIDAIGHLASGIAHDLNNVLAPVLMAIESLRLKLTDEEALTLLALLKVSTERGAALVSQMLSFAKGSNTTIRTSLQLKYLITDLAKVLKQLLPKSISIKVNLHDELWTIVGDVMQLYQVLMNLCMNARDAMPAGGQLSITAENTYISKNDGLINLDFDPQRFVLITISDTGMGISSSIIGKIFEPFFTTKEPDKGTGLGLSTALEIVKRHGGSINVNSKVGSGTSFKVYLPAAKESERLGQLEVENEATELPLGAGESVLIVDDELPMRVACERVLEAFGYAVFTAGEGIEAVRQQAQNGDKIKFVVLDMNMPNMDGVETVHELLRVNPQVKILAVSGSDAEERLAELVKNGAVRAFIRKPYTAQRLLRTLAEIREME
jgi:two-component system cell cycle sensor histidine kinase/response regulator CckA